MITNSSDTSDLPGFVAVDDGALLGAVIYRMHGGECEVSALFSLVQGIGAGTRLLVNLFPDPLIIKGTFLYI